MANDVEPMRVEWVALDDLNSLVKAVAVGLSSRWKQQRLPANVDAFPADRPFASALCLQDPPWFPVCPNYEAKAWLRVLIEARGRVLFWNVIGA